MSFYSSLILFYPGRLPQITLDSFRNLCDVVRVNFSLSDSPLGAKIVYETNDAVAPGISWNEANTIGVCEEDLWKPQKWDHANSRMAWQQLWPVTTPDDTLIRRASVNLGSLPQLLGEELTVSSKDGSSYIAPVELSVSVGPVMPMTLDDGLSPNECYGNLKLSLSGMGYFTWQPLSAYWEFARQGNNIQKLLRTCRDVYPAPPLVEPDFLKERLGELFLNQKEYQPGDWIVSVSESG